MASPFYKLWVCGSHALFVSFALLLVLRTDGKTKEAKAVQGLQE